MKKIVLIVLCAVLLAVAAVLLWFHAVGKGWIGGGPWESAPVADGPREQRTVADDTPQILFGDLHTHTNYSLDAYLFNTQLIKGGGVVTPADACDFARYCSALDFWSINDHAESLTPRVWSDTVEAIRACNAQSGDPDNPDMVSLVGWEWSNSNSDDVPSHFGHKNVIFRTWEPGRAPTRPIASAERYPTAQVPSALLGLISLVEDRKETSDFGWYNNESSTVPICPEGISADELPADCREVALTPSELYRKLDEWGFDSLVIPHGLAWGTTNPLTADFRRQLDEYEARYQKLLETFSGHGNSERFEDFQRVGVADDGTLYCPQPTANFTPCCRRAAELARAACESGSGECEQQAQSIMTAYVEAGPRAGRKLLPEATVDDWAGCGHLQNSFQPASMYVPRQSTQYNLALGFDENGAPKRVRFGLIGSSDNHVARPGNTYKELNRPIMTDNKSVTGEPTWSYSADRESGSFYYTGGLVAAHTNGRDRDAVWKALDTRNVYATSGDRMLVWFDLVNAPSGEQPMGSEVHMATSPRFRVRALGAFEQQPGCPEEAVTALGRERVASLCGGECYRPGDKRKRIERIEITRIRPQQNPQEAIAPLIEHRWREFQCEPSEEGCTVEFTDPEFVASARPSLYYARVLQEAEPLISGDPFGCVYDASGACVQRNYCIDENAGPGEDCTAPAQPRAWTSPIYVNFAR